MATHKSLHASQEGKHHFDYPRVHPLQFNQLYAVLIAVPICGALGSSVSISLSFSSSGASNAIIKQLSDTIDIPS
jgi:hypothetical protein